MGKRRGRAGHDYNPETHALGLGYEPSLSQGSVKPPVFLTSTFQFDSAEEGKGFFELAYGLREKEAGETAGLIYSRLNNPNLQMFEERMAAWDQTEKGSVFASGMAAISTTLLALVKPGDVVLSSAPVYGGTHYLFEHILPSLNVEVHQVAAGPNTVALMAEKATEVGEDRVRLLYLESPANPSNTQVDIKAISRLGHQLNERTGKDRPTLTAVDNTFLGPVFQRPAPLGADLVIYSATKFIGGHSDLVAGVVTGTKVMIDEINVYRTILGTIANPFTGWLLLRSLETVSVRMRRQAKTAKALALMIAEHPKVLRVSFPGLLQKGDEDYSLYKRQCSGPGSLIAFEVMGGERGAFAVLNNLEVCRLAVSLGGTESLAEHPMSMTHADVPPAQLEEYGVRAGMIRLSVGLEHLSDLRRDIKTALDSVQDC